MPRITVTNLTVHYQNGRSGNVIALNGLNAVFLSDAFNVVIGYSGCGKTTLLRCIAGLIDYEGNVLFDNVDIFELRPSERNIAYVSQEYALYPHLTVFDNIAFPLKVAGVPKVEIVERVKKIAEQLELTYCLTRKPKHISGGQQQRVALARALIRKPSVCLFDEPLSNIDSQLRIQERRLIKEIMTQYGCTSIYVTHNLPEAMTLADRLFVLSNGKCELQGDPVSVYRSGNETVEALKCEAGQI